MLYLGLGNISDTSTQRNTSIKPYNGHEVVKKVK
jgi:hypothetical protein